MIIRIKYIVISITNKISGFCSRLGLDKLAKFCSPVKLILFGFHNIDSTEKNQENP